MKILITNSFYPPYHVGGDATHCKYLAEALVQEGHEVHVIFSYDAYALKKAYGQKEENWNGVKVHKIKSPLKKLEPILNYLDRKSTRLNSSHMSISYAVFCLK